MKVSILFGNDLWSAEWQNKTFKDEMSIVEFCRKHRERVHGVNGKIFKGFPFPTHFEILDAIEGR